MNKFDFDELTIRRGSGCVKWDEMPDDHIIPLWVADMDFRTAPAVTEALARRVTTGIFGYTEPEPTYFKSLISWFERRHGWRIDRDSVIYTSGVVPAISAIIKALTIPGDGVILQTPAYNCFFSSVRNNGCREYDNPLIRIETERGFSYRMDFDNLESLASDPRNKLLILCNPHNPTGRLWTREELDTVRDICGRNDVIVISDEIHCELTPPQKGYIPYATVDDQSIICCSPSKAFNTAGLQIANIICPDEKLRFKIDRAINDNEVCDVNPFGVAGLQAAYDDGEQWLDSLRLYLHENQQLVRERLDGLCGWKICESEATYLAWIDVSAGGMNGDRTENYLMEAAGVRISSGSIYGDNRYIRLNYACPRRRLTQALDRICHAMKSQENDAKTLRQNKHKK